MGWGSNPHAASSARLTAVFLTIRSTHEHPNNRKAQILDSGLGPFQFYHSLLGKNLSETLVRTAITLRRCCRWCKGAMLWNQSHVLYFLTDALSCQACFQNSGILFPLMLNGAELSGIPTIPDPPQLGHGICGQQ